MRMLPSPPSGRRRSGGTSRAARLAADVLEAEWLGRQARPRCDTEVEKHLPWKALRLQEVGYYLSLEGCELSPDVHKADRALGCNPGADFSAGVQRAYAGCEGPIARDEGVNG